LKGVRRDIVRAEAPEHKSRIRKPKLTEKRKTGGVYARGNRGARRSVIGKENDEKSEITPLESKRGEI